MTIKDIKNIDRKIHRVDGKLFELIEVKNDDGATVRQFDFPLHVELRLHDMMEIIVGASILAVPVAFTEEVWDMGDQLPWANTALLSAISLIFIAAFVYYSSYRLHIKMFKKEFVMRVLTIFTLSLVVVGLLLTIVNKCPWLTDFDLAMKRTMIGAFPASMSATVTDQMNG